MTDEKKPTVKSIVLGELKRGTTSIETISKKHNLKPNIVYYYKHYFFDMKTRKELTPVRRKKNE